MNDPSTDSSADSSADSSVPSSPVPADSPPVAKGRNPTERILVWGVIGLLLIVVAIEGSARIGYTLTLNRLSRVLGLDDQLEPQPLHIDDVPALVSGFPSRTVEGGEFGSVVTYRWKGLLKDYGGIHLEYTDDEGLVLGLQTDDPPEDPRLIAEAAPQGDQVEEPLDDQEGGEMTPDEQAETAGQEGGRRRVPFSELDIDGDGKLSREEVPERLRDNFDEIDLNGDGYVDEEEWAARRAARADAATPEEQPVP